MSYINELLDNYTPIPNELINDTSLAPDVRFLFVYLASKRTGWKFSQANIARSMCIKKVDTLRKKLKELDDEGWITIVKQQKVLKEGVGSVFDSNNYIIHAQKQKRLSRENSSYPVQRATRSTCDTLKGVHSNTNNKYIEEKQVFSEKKLEEKISEENHTPRVQKTHLDLAADFWLYLSETQQGGYKLSAIKNNAVIQRKKLSDERLQEETIKFYTHHQTNPLIVTLSVEDKRLRAEFEKWLIRDLCKPEKTIEQTAKKQSWQIKNDTDKIEKIEKKVPLLFDLVTLIKLEKACKGFIEEEKYNNLKKQDSKKAYELLRLRFLHLLRTNQIDISVF